MSNVENLNRVRHPEKVKKPEHEPLRKPSWIRVKAPTSDGYHQTVSYTHLTLPTILRV